ncbi:Uncharacterized mitochondrial protein AtMg00310 [Linum perenne]
MTRKSIHWCKGEKLCDAQRDGGLGFREFGAFNKALLARQGWRLINSPDALWAKLLKSLYFPSGNFLLASKGRRPSWIWASLLDALSTLNLGCIKVVGNGDSIKVNDDPWIPGLPSFRTQMQSIDSRKASDFIDSTTRDWDPNLLQNSFSPIKSKAIMEIPVGPPNFDDFWA